MSDEPSRDPSVLPAAPPAASWTGKGVLLFVVMPLVVSLMVWIWIRNERGALRDRGAVACNEGKHDEAWCKSAADRHHERCVELTFTPASKTSPASFDTNGYVECIDVGPQEYWRLSAERAAERRRGLRLPTGPSYH